MSSIADPRLALLGTAIDDLAAAAGPGAEELDSLAARLADLWALVAELDPGLAARLSRYTATD